ATTRTGRALRRRWVARAGAVMTAKVRPYAAREAGRLSTEDFQRHVLGDLPEPEVLAGVDRDVGLPLLNGLPEGRLISHLPVVVRAPLLQVGSAAAGGIVVGVGPGH